MLSLALAGSKEKKNKIEFKKKLGSLSLDISCLVVCDFARQTSKRLDKETGQRQKWKNLFRGVGHKESMSDSKAKQSECSMTHVMLLFLIIC